MTPSGAFPSHLRRRLRCPVCHAPLTDRGDERLACTNAECGTVFPVVSGVPVLINEANSVFSIEDFVTHARKIGTIITESEFIASRYGDYRLFFQHNTRFLRDEFKKP